MPTRLRSADTKPSGLLHRSRHGQPDKTKGLLYTRRANTKTRSGNSQPHKNRAIHKDLSGDQAALVGEVQERIGDTETANSKTVEPAAGS